MPNFDYTSRDYNSIRASLQARASASIPEWSGNSNSDFMSSLIDLWAYNADILHYYIDRASTEAFLSTATQRESVLSMANLYGYTPNYMSSATTTLTITNSGASVTIPVNTPFKSTNNLYWFNELETTIPANSTNTVFVKQGIKYFNEAVSSDTDNTSTQSNGNPSQRFNIYRTGVDPASVVVNVAEGENGSGKTWARVNSIIPYNSNDSVFAISVTSKGVCQIIFGNGVNGRIPPINAAITATYVKSDGIKGNVSANNINTIGNSLYPTLSATNLVASSGGLDYETVDSIKNAIPSLMRTRNGAVSLSDFQDIALTTQGVAKAYVSYASSTITATVIPDQAAYLTDGAASVSIDQNLRDRVSRDLLGRAMLGVTTISVPSTVSFTKIYVYLDLFVKSSYIQSVIKTEVQDALESLFAFDSVSFGDTVTVGEIYRTAMAIAGVDYVIVKGFTTSTAGTPATTIDGSGKIVVASNQLPKLGIVTITPSGGVSAV
jgi:hypothetical protein